MYSPILTVAMTSETFHLVRNSMDVGRLRLLLGLGIVLIPTLFANAIFASTFHLEATGLIIATSITGLLLFNIAFLLWNKMTMGNQTIIFGFNNLRIIENNTTVKVIPFEQLEFIRLTYGMGNGKRLPAIRIKAKDFGCMTIGSNQISNDWKATGEQVDCTTYLIASSEEWKRFIEIINQLK